MITHDRYFLDSVTNRIVELDRGKLYSYQTNYEGFVKLKAERMDMAAGHLSASARPFCGRSLPGCSGEQEPAPPSRRLTSSALRTLRDMKAPEFDKEVELESISSRLGRTTVEAEGSLQGIRGQGSVKGFHLHLSEK